MDNQADNAGKSRKQSKSDKRDSQIFITKKRSLSDPSGAPGEDSKKLCIQLKRPWRPSEESKVALVSRSPVAAAPSAEEATAAEGEVLAAAEAEAAAGMAEAVVAAVDAAAAAATSGGGSDEAPVADETDPQDNVAAEGKSKRTVAAMLGYGHATNLLSGDAPRHYVHYPHHYHQQQPQYSQPAPHQQQQYQQYHTLRYYPSKAAAEHAASVPSGGRPHYQIQYTAYVPPQANPATAATAVPANPAVHYAQGASAQQLVQVAPVPAASQQIIAFQQPAHPALYAQQQVSQQLIPVIIVRVADPAQHGLATAALLPASALGLSAVPAIQGLQALQGLHTPATLQGLLLGHYMQQAVAAAQQQQAQQAPAAQTYYSADPTPQLTQHQLKQLYAQQQAAAAVATSGTASEAKKPPTVSASQQKARKGSVTIEAAQNVDNSHTQYKYSTFKDKN